MDRSETVLIVGGSVGGLTAALALRRHGFRVRVFERRELPEMRAAAGFGHTIWSNATTSLERLGLGPALRERSEEVRRFRSFDATGAVRMETEVTETVWPGCPLPAGIGRGDLVELLRSTCLDLGVEITHGARVAGYTDGADGVTLTLEDGSSHRGTVLVGADGIRSTILAQLYGRVPAVYSGRTTYRGIAVGACGLARNTVHLFANADLNVGGGAWLIGGDRVVWTLSCEAPEDAPDEPAQLQQRARELAAVLAGPPKDFVDGTPAGTVSRTPIYYHEWHEKWGEGRVTLLGDAAHTLPTDLGQGACQAIEDAVVLADSLATAADPVAGLRDYERRRVERVRWVRTQVMRVNKMPSLRNPVARRAFEVAARLIGPAIQRKLWKRIQRPPELRAAPPVRAEVTFPG